MRFSLTIAGVLLRAGLSLAKPYSYEKDGIVYNALSRDGASAQNEAAIQARGMVLQRANAADCLGSYNLVATGTGPSPTGTPDPNFDFFVFCSSFIQPTKTYTVTLRSSTRPSIVTVTVTSTRSSTKPTLTLFPTSTTEPPVTVIVTVTATRSSIKPTSTSEEEEPVVTVTVTATKSSIKPTSSSLSIPPVVVTVTVTATKTSSSTTTSSTSKLPTTTSTTSKPPPTTSTRSMTSLGITRTQPITTSSFSTTSEVPIPPPTTTTTRQQPAATGTLCPTAIAGQRCGNPGWGYAENNLYFGSPVDAASCSQLCLANPDCKSYQTQDSSYESPQCNLYRVDSSGNNTIAGAAPFVFYDRGCQDFAPIACSKTAPPSTTAQPTLSVGFGLVERQRGGGRTQSLPWFLEPFDPITISEVCSCIITVAPPALSFTTTIGW